MINNFESFAARVSLHFFFGEWSQLSPGQNSPDRIRGCKCLGMGDFLGDFQTFLGVIVIHLMGQTVSSDSFMLNSTK